MNSPFAQVDWHDGTLDVPGMQSSAKKLGQLKGIFLDEQAWQSLDPETIVYRVWWWEPVSPGTTGGLFWGLTEIQSGKVGCEYFMTHGHRHAIVDRAEFYSTVKGQGILVLRDESGQTRSEEMKPGSLHYIPGRVSHRVVNTGTTPLRFVACWPSDAGHDYTAATGTGFGVRVVEEHGKALVTRESK